MWDLPFERGAVRPKLVLKVHPAEGRVPNTVALSRLFEAARRTPGERRYESRSLGRAAASRSWRMLVKQPKRTEQDRTGNIEKVAITHQRMPTYAS